MALLGNFQRTHKPRRLERLPSGCFSVHRGGDLVAWTLPSSFPKATLLEIGRVVRKIFEEASRAQLPLDDLHIHYSGLTILARELRGGALVFLKPATLNLTRTVALPPMHHKTLEEFILHLENYVECWKQFNGYIQLARDKNFTRDDENQFLEVKSIIAQGLEAILDGADKQAPRREEITALFGSAPSLRFLCDMPDALQGVEAQWHKIYLSLQMLLGQLKVQESKQDKGAGWNLFGKK